MTNIQREHIVERYLGGELSPLEEHDFFIQVAVDDELRRTLKAYTIVENAIRKDKDTARSSNQGSRVHVAGILAQTPTLPGLSGIPSRPGFLHVATLALRSFMGSSVAKGVAAVAASVVLAGSAFLVSTSNSSTNIPADVQQTKGLQTPVIFEQPEEVPPAVPAKTGSAAAILKGPLSRNTVVTQPGPDVPTAKDVTGNQSDDQRLPVSVAIPTATARTIKPEATVTTTTVQPVTSDNTQAATNASTAIDQNRPTPYLQQDSISFKARINLPKNMFKDE